MLSPSGPPVTHSPPGTKPIAHLDPTAQSTQPRAFDVAAGDGVEKHKVAARNVSPTVSDIADDSKQDGVITIVADEAEYSPVVAVWSAAQNGVVTVIGDEVESSDVAVQSNSPAGSMVSAVLPIVTLVPCSGNPSKNPATEVLNATQAREIKTPQPDGENNADAERKAVSLFDSSVENRPGSPPKAQLLEQIDLACVVQGPKEPNAENRLSLPPGVGSSDSGPVDESKMQELPAKTSDDFLSGASHSPAQAGPSAPPPATQSDGSHESVQPTTSLSDARGENECTGPDCSTKENPDAVGVPQESQQELSPRNCCSPSPPKVKVGTNNEEVGSSEASPAVALASPSAEEVRSPTNGEGAKDTNENECETRGKTAPEDENEDRVSSETRLKADEDKNEKPKEKCSPEIPQAIADETDASALTGPRLQDGRPSDIMARPKNGLLMASSRTPLDKPKSAQPLRAWRGRSKSASISPNLRRRSKGRSAKHQSHRKVSAKRSRDREGRKSREKVTDKRRRSRSKVRGRNRSGSRRRRSPSTQKKTRSPRRSRSRSRRSQWQKSKGRKKDAKRKQSRSPRRLKARSASSPSIRKHPPKRKAKRDSSSSAFRKSQKRKAQAVAASAKISRVLNSPSSSPSRPKKKALRIAPRKSPPRKCTRRSSTPKRKLLRRRSLSQKRSLQNSPSPRKSTPRRSPPGRKPKRSPSASTSSPAPQLRAKRVAAKSSAMSSRTGGKAVATRATSLSSSDQVPDPPRKKSKKKQESAKAEKKERKQKKQKEKQNQKMLKAMGMERAKATAEMPNRSCASKLVATPIAGVTHKLQPVSKVSSSVIQARPKVATVVKPVVQSLPPGFEEEYSYEYETEEDGVTPVALATPLPNKALPPSYGTPLPNKALPPSYGTHAKATSSSKAPSSALPKRWAPPRAPTPPPPHVTDDGYDSGTATSQADGYGVDEDVVCLSSEEERPRMALPVQAVPFRAGIGSNAKVNQDRSRAAEKQRAVSAAKVVAALQQFSSDFGGAGVADPVAPSVNEEPDSSLGFSEVEVQRRLKATQKHLLKIQLDAKAAELIKLRKRFGRAKMQKNAAVAKLGGAASVVADAEPTRTVHKSFWARKPVASATRTPTSPKKANAPELTSMQRTMQMQKEKVDEQRTRLMLALEKRQSQQVDGFKEIPPETAAVDEENLIRD